ncbi:hypothetical protein BDW74DRAFT_78926 [Aspergillus multicolor]|uniref:uncharacterized protein n=1 Tax=Aspergillus multicolor TaxID=41759 RepID=UPI003CCCAEC8
MTIVRKAGLYFGPVGVYFGIMIWRLIYIAVVSCFLFDFLADILYDRTRLAAFWLI